MRKITAALLIGLTAGVGLFKNTESSGSKSENEVKAFKKRMERSTYVQRNNPPHKKRCQKNAKKLARLNAKSNRQG